MALAGGLVVLEADERCFLRSTVKRKGQDQSVILVVTDRALYEATPTHGGATCDAPLPPPSSGVMSSYFGSVDGATAAAPPPPELHRWSFRELHSVHRMEKHNVVRVFLISATALGKSSGNKEKVKGWGAGETASNFVVPRDFLCASPEERDLLFLVLRANLVDTWQANLECETESIPPTEHYQSHLFLTKRNRKGKLQIRFVVLTNRKLYNFEARVVGRKIEPHKCKWAFPIGDLRRVTSYVDDPQALAITVDTRAAERKQVKSTVTYLVDNKHERTLFIGDLRRLYFEAKGAELEQEETTISTSTTKK